MRESPVAGVHYPRGYEDFLAWFATDDDCADYLEWLRWPHGFECASCGSLAECRLGDRRIKCGSCGARTSVTAGTIFDRTRTPLTVWFHAAWAFATAKDGVSALALKKTLGVGSYQTAWAMLSRLRSVAVRPGRELLFGEVEVDETFIGGTAEGDRGGRTPGEKMLVGIAVERLSPKGFGRIRMGVLDSARAADLRPFLRENVRIGSTVVTDGWPAYRGACGGDYLHQAHVAPGALAHQLLPGVHRVASLVKRWLGSTHQGSVGDTHLPLYLNEYVFRFNRRNARHRGLLFYRLLELAVAAEPVRYSDLRHTKRPKADRHIPPATRGKPSSLEIRRALRPWRRAVELAS